MTTKELILNEDKINWDDLSKDPNRAFSLAEIRMFRKRINWIAYLSNHNMSHDEMTIASKHFTREVYEFIALNNFADQDFIQEHLKDFDIKLLSRASYLSQDTLMRIATGNYIALNVLLESLEMNKLIDLHDGSYDEFLLFANLS